MKTLKPKHALLFSLIIFLSLSCKKTNSEEDSNDNPNPTQLTGSYFNIPFPSTTVTRFAPDVFTQELHATPFFTPNGEEVFWSLMGGQDLMYMKLENGYWTNPAIAPFNLSGSSDSPFISADGTKLLFLSGYNSTKENIWMVEKTNGVWGSPQKLGNAVNQLPVHWLASMANNQNIYFAADGELYFSEFVNGTYTTAQKLGSTFNTEEAYEGSPFIAPDESYLIFSRAPYYADLYISFKKSDGSWSEAVNMTELNTDLHEMYAYVSSDGRFIMFMSGRSGILLPYWVDASIIENYRPVQ